MIYDLRIMIFCFFCVIFRRCSGRRLRPSAVLIRCYLKKQSQFSEGKIDVKSYMKGDYGNNPLCGAQKNKAKQTQFI
jgi:hypothetical protein